jgi:sensor c-di-GMP phosphodiesterase-like protein
MRLAHIKYVISSHPRVVAFVGALIVSTITLGAALSLIVRSQYQKIDESLALASERASAVRNQASEILTTLNRNVVPGCSLVSLLQLRKMVYESEYIAEIGVVNEHGLLVCNTTEGLLIEPEAFKLPDVSGKAEDGRDFDIWYNVPTSSDGNLKSTIVRRGRFTVAIQPRLLRSILSVGISAAQYVGPTGETVAIISAPRLPAQWQSRLSSSAYTKTGTYTADLWRSLAFVEAKRVDGTRNVVQVVVTGQEFFSTYSGSLVMTALACLFLFFLIHELLRQRYLHWASLRYRIDYLLRAENIVCMYQPVVDLQTQKPVGCEVLMRLRDGDKLLYPDTVIPAIIEKKLTWQLDQLMVQVAGRELLSALPQPGPFKLAFNFFPDNITHDKLHGLFESVFTPRAPLGLRLDIEVIEQHYQASIVQEVKHLRAEGYLISVDDFGTGYSNLGSIKALSPDFLKVDKSFIFDMEERTVRSSLIPEIIAIGRSVGAKMIAEGIENESQARLLTELGVEFGQGYYFAKPMSMDALVEHMRKNGSACIA